MAGGHDHGHDHHGHDHHGHDHGDKLIELSAKKPSKLKSLESEALIHVSGIETGSFAIASNKKQLKALMGSEADVVYDGKKGKLYHNANGGEKGWGKKKVGGLIARIKSKPELNTEHFENLEPFAEDQLTGSMPKDEHEHDKHEHNHHDLDNKNGADDETPMKTMFSNKSEAKAAAKDFGCTGAHKMGDFWMPCREMSEMKIPSGDHSGDEHSGHQHDEHHHSGHDGHAVHDIV